MTDPVWVILLVDCRRIGATIKLLQCHGCFGFNPTTSLQYAAKFDSEREAENIIRCAHSGDDIRKLVHWKTNDVYLMFPACIERPPAKRPARVKPVESPLLPMGWDA